MVDGIEKVVDIV